MNKKIIGVIVAIVAVLAVIIGMVIIMNNNSNSNVEQQTNTSNTISSQDAIIQNNEQNAIETEETTSNSKILIAYFSRPDENYNVGTVEVGNTEILAGFIKDYLGTKADTFKIDPVVAYPTNYKECTEYATKEKDSNARPEFKNAESLDLSKYDTIFIGYPIWWGDVPMIINTFLEKYDFSGKIIIPFNTHEGSGNSGTYTSIENKMASSEVNTNGLAIRGKEAREDSSRSTVENWLKGLGY